MISGIPIKKQGGAAHPLVGKIIAGASNCPFT